MQKLLSMEEMKKRYEELYAKLGQIAESRGEAKGVFSKIFNKKK